MTEVFHEKPCFTVGETAAFLKQQDDAQAWALEEECDGYVQ